MIARRAAVLAIAAAGFAAIAAPASAEPPFPATCGAVRAFTPPTAATAGSITIGDVTFALTARDPIAASVGTVTCINRGMTTTGPVLVLVPMPSPMCGEIIGSVTPGKLVDIVAGPGFRVGILAGAGMSLPDSITSVSVGCLEVAIDSGGRAVAVRVMGALVTPPPVPTATPRPVGNLPSTSTSSTAGAAVGAVALLITLAAYTTSRLRRRFGARRGSGLMDEREVPAPALAVRAHDEIDPAIGDARLSPH